jgi:DNA end-binding protein Ku
MHFVPMSTLELNYIMNTYYVIPDKQGQKGYALFAESMAEKGLMAVCKVFKKNRDGSIRDRLAVVRPFKNGLIFHNIYYSNEIRPFSENITVVESSAAEKQITGALIDSMTEEDFTVAKYHNEYNEKVMALVLEKAKAKLIQQGE